MITYEQIKAANAGIKTLDVKGKDYAMVNQRVDAFRKVYPDGYIDTVMISNEDGVCVFRAECGYTGESGKVILGTGTAYERESSSYINKTSYIENCETSAVGRALGFAGFGIDASIASAEEVINAINQQEADKKPQPKQKHAPVVPEFKNAPKRGEPDPDPKPEPMGRQEMLGIVEKLYKGVNLTNLMNHNGIETLDEIGQDALESLIAKLRKAGKIQ